MSNITSLISNIEDLTYDDLLQELLKLGQVELQKHSSLIAEVLIGCRDLKKIECLINACESRDLVKDIFLNNIIRRLNFESEKSIYLTPKLIIDDQQILFALFYDNYHAAEQLFKKSKLNSLHLSYILSDYENYQIYLENYLNQQSIDNIEELKKVFSNPKYLLSMENKSEDLFEIAIMGAIFNKDIEIVTFITEGKYKINEKLLNELIIFCMLTNNNEEISSLINNFHLDSFSLAQCLQHTMMFNKTKEFSNIIESVKELSTHDLRKIIVKSFGARSNSIINYMYNNKMISDHKDFFSILLEQFKIEIEIESNRVGITFSEVLDNTQIYHIFSKVKKLLTHEKLTELLKLNNDVENPVLFSDEQIIQLMNSDKYVVGFALKNVKMNYDIDLYKKIQQTTQFDDYFKRHLLFNLKYHEQFYQELKSLEPNIFEKILGDELLFDNESLFRDTIINSSMFEGGGAFFHDALSKPGYILPLDIITVLHNSFDQFKLIIDSGNFVNEVNKIIGFILANKLIYKRHYNFLLSKREYKEYIDNIKKILNSNNEQSSLDQIENISCESKLFCLATCYIESNQELLFNKAYENINSDVKLFPFIIQYLHKTGIKVSNIILKTIIMSSDKLPVDGASYMLISFLSSANIDSIKTTLDNIPEKIEIGHDILEVASYGKEIAKLVLNHEK